MVGYAGFDRALICRRKKRQYQCGTEAEVKVEDAKALESEIRVRGGEKGRGRSEKEYCGQVKRAEINMFRFLHRAMDFYTKYLKEGEAATPEITR